MSSAALRWALPLGSVVIIAVGAAIAVSGSTTVGIIIAAVGLVDLATVPFILRRAGNARTTERAPLSTPDAAADPSYNPYARED